MTGKILIKCDLVVRTGLHIGDSSSFSAIGTVDSTVIRDPFTGLPIVPGSSLKGKLRTLLARRSCVNGENAAGFFRRWRGDPADVRRLRTGPLCAAAVCGRLSAQLRSAESVGVTEVKSENVINRLTSKATHRQMSALLPVPGSGSTSFTTCPTPKRWKRTFCFCPRP